MTHEQVEQPTPGWAAGQAAREPAYERAHEQVGVWERRTDGLAVRVVPERGAGRTWRVWAAGCTHVPGAPACDCLVFDTGEVIRRVWGVPPAWAALPDDALLALTARVSAER